jgi:competence protein ComEA
VVGRTVSFLKTEEVTIMFKSFLAALVGLGFTFAVWAAPVNVNSASAEELSENLSGVGATIAERIIEARESGGPFKDANDLQTRVNGIGPATIERNKDDLQF